MESILRRTRAVARTGRRRLLERGLWTGDSALHVAECAVYAEHQRGPACDRAGGKVMRLGYAKAEKVWRCSGNRDRWQICRLERKSERAAHCYPRPAKYRRQGGVLALLGKARSGLFDRRIRFRYVLALRADPDAGGSHHLRGGRHRKHDGCRIESQQFPFVAARADFALSCCLMLQSTEGSHDDQSSTHYRSKGSERTGEITKVGYGQRPSEKTSASAVIRSVSV